MDTDVCVGGGPLAKGKNIFKDRAYRTEEMAQWVRAPCLQA